MTGTSTTVGIEVRAEGTQTAARDLAVVDASVKKIGTSLGTVSQFASTVKLDRTIADLGDMGVKINANSRHVQNLARMMQAVDRDRAFRQLAQDANLSTLQLAKLRAEMGDTRGALATLSSGFGSAKIAALAFAAALALGGKAALEAALQMDRLEKAYTTITGSASAAQVQLAYLYDVSNRLGLQFQSTAEAAKTFFAAGKGTSLEKDMNAIFEAVSSAGSALSLSTDDMHGAFLALGQMISKGKVQAEELRGQLGERLPGAFQLAAKAMNMTTAELDKFMADGKLTAEVLLPKLAKVMREDFGAAAEEAATGIQGALNRLSTEWELFKASLVDSEAAVAGIDAVRGTVAILQAAFDTLAKYKDIFKALAVGIGITALIALVPRATEAVLGLASAFKTLLPLLVANPWVLAAVAIGAVGAGLVYYTDHVDAATQAQKTLDAAQKQSIELNKALTASREQSTQALADYATAAESTVAEIEGTLTTLQESLTAALDFGKLSSGVEAPWMSYLIDDSVFATLDTFEQRLVDLRTEASQTGDYQTLQRAVNDLASEARASGKDTAELQKAIEDTQRVAALGIQLQVNLDGYEDVRRKLNQLKYLRELYDGASVGLSETDWREERDRKNFAANRQFLEELDGLYKKTGTSRREEIQKTIVKLEEEEKYLNQRGLGEQDRLKAQIQLSAALAKARNDLLALDKKGQKKDTSLEQAQRNLEAYDAELGKVEAAITSLHAQLAAPKGELFTREQAKIAAEYETTLKNIDKIAAEYARKKGVSTEQAAQLKTQKLIEAGLKRDLALREAQEKEEKRLADLAKDRYEFYKELEEITGQYGLSLQYQSEVIAAQVTELERLQIPQEYIDQWQQLKDLQASHDWVDGAKRGLMEYQASASDAAKSAEDAFSSLFNGMDSGWQSAWQQMIETGKVSLSSFRSLFASFIADLMHMAITRPITVQIAGVVSGMLGSSGVASAAGAGGAGGMNLGGLPFGSLIPESWTSGASGLFSGVTSGINNFGNTLLPSVFAGNFANPAEAALASFSGAPTLFGTLGAAGAGFGLGGLAGKLLFPDKPNISMGSGIGGGLGAAVGTLFGGGIGTLIGGGIGSLLGGGIGSLFGSKKPKRPAVWGGMNLNLGDADAYDNYDFTSTYDRKGYGKSDFEVTEADYYTIASRDRNKAGGETSKAMQDVLKSVADSAIAQAQAVQKALPEEYAKQFKTQLSQHAIVADVGLKGDDISKEGFEKIAADVQEQVNESLLKSFQGMDFSAYSGKIDIDQSTIEGLDKFTKALTSIDTAVSSTEQLKNPLSDIEQQAKAAVEQMKAWEDSMRSFGVESEYAATLMEDYRVATVDKFMKSIQDTVNPMSQLEQQAKAQVEQINGWVAALKTMSATEAQVAEAEHARVVAQENLLQTFRDATSPMSDLEKQTRTAIDAITQTVAAMRILGNAEADIAEVEAHRVVVQNNLLDAAHRLVTVTPAIVTATDSVNAEFDAFVAAMKIAGGSLSDLARLEADRISAIQAAVDTLHVPFYDNLTVRTETVLGNDTSTLQLEIAQKKELEEAIKTFGKDSAEYLALVSVQNAESVKHQSDLAKQAADEATRAYENAQASAKSFAQAVEQSSNALHQADINVATAKNALLRYFSDAVTSAENAVKAAKDAQEQLRLSLVQALVGAVDAAKSSTQSAVDAWASEAQSAFEQAQSAYANALDEEASGIKNLVDRHKSLAESMRNLRKDMWLDSHTNPTSSMGAYKSAQSEMQSLFALAKGGDVDAASRFQDISRTFLDASLSTSSSSSEYQEDFYSVNAMLAELEASSQVQSDAQQAQLDALNAQIEGLKEQKKTTEQLRIEMEAARKQVERANKEQTEFYARWNLEKLIPGVTGLETQYIAQSEALRIANEALNQALGDKLTTQSEIDSLRIKDEITRFATEYKTAMETTLQKEQEHADALQAKLDAESKWGVLEVKTQLQLLQDALSAAIGEQTTALNAVLAAQEAAARAAEEAARAQAEAARQQAAANAQAEAARKAAEEAAKNKAEAEAKYGGKSQAQLIAEKAAAMNNGQTLSPGQTAGGWTSASVLADITAGGMTVGEWYDKYGKAEGFASGGLAKPGWAIVGERGPELVNFSTPGRVYTAEQTQRMMMQPAIGTDAHPAAEQAWMQERMQVQDIAFAEMISVLREIGKEVYRSRDLLDGMSENGIGTYALTQSVQKTTWTN